MKKSIAIILSIILILAFTLPAAALSKVAVKSINLNNSKISLKVGDTSTLKVTFTPANTTQKTLSYVTGNKRIATVDATGKIIGVSAGTTTITVYTAVKTIFAKCDITVSQLDYAKDTSPITLDWFINIDWWSNQWDTKMLAYREATKRTGVTVNITTPTAGSTEKLNTMIAANELPDIISSESNSQLALLKSANKVEPLLPLIRKEAPDFEKLIPKSMIDWFKAEDGNWYDLANFFMTDNEKGSNNYYAANDTIVARKDIMDKLGIKPDDFSTQAGMITALKKVAAAKLKYNNQKVVPFYCGPQAGVTELFQWVIWDMFAVPSETKDGKFADRRYDPKNLEALKFGNKLYREGLFPKDNFTAQRMQIEEKITSGAVFCFMGNKGDYQGPFRTVFENDNKAEYVAVGPVRANDGAKPAFGGSLGGWVHTTISQTSKKKQRAIRFLEFLYSNEGSILMNYGIRGQTFKDGANGHYAWTDTYIKDIEEASKNKVPDKYAVGGFWLVHNWPLIQATEILPTKPVDLIIKKLDNFNAQFLYNNMCEGNIDPEGGTDEAIMKKKIADYYDLQVSKMLMANSEQACMTIYNETIKHMNELGHDKVMKVMDAKFQANKKKLGVKFVYPTNMK
jgi:putative aldouronate transport system substrate-binding protein